MDLLQFSSAGSIDFTAFDVVETHSAKIWLGALCVDKITCIPDMLYARPSSGGNVP
jgi:hypothetical protein